MRHAYLFFSFILACLALILVLSLKSRKDAALFIALQSDYKEVVTALKLTDMFFSHDARYTRHPSQADLFSAFQDYPSSIEHFPSGSVAPPPDFASANTRITVKKK